MNSRETGEILRRHDWPEWWEWELEFSPHLFRRMDDRGFNEIDLRTMLERASGYRKDVVDGRCVIETRHRRRRWEIIVEPDARLKLVVVVTAFPAWEN